jgi:hypothetical protein
LISDRSYKGNEDELLRKIIEKYNLPRDALVVRVFLFQMFPILMPDNSFVAQVKRAPEQVVVKLLEHFGMCYPLDDGTRLVQHEVVETRDIYRFNRFSRRVLFPVLLNHSTPQQVGSEMT